MIWNRKHLPTRATAILISVGAGPIGRRIRLYGSDTWLEVIGVVGDVKLAGLHRNLPAQVYQPFAQAPRGTLSVVVRAEHDGKLAADRIRAAIRGVDPDQAASAPRPLAETVVATNPLAGAPVP
jgi:hypothetical protein